VLFKDCLKVYRPRKNLFSQTDTKRIVQSGRIDTLLGLKKNAFPDETKVERLRSAGSTYVRRRVGEALDEKCIIPTLKFGGNVKLWGCFGIGSPGQLNFIEGKLTGVRYIEVLEQSMLPCARKIAGRTNIYQEDNDPKHAGERGCKIVKNG